VIGRFWTVREPGAQQSKDARRGHRWLPGYAACFLNLAELPLQHLNNNAPPVLRLTFQFKQEYLCACVLVSHEHASLLMLLDSRFGFACLCWPVHGILCMLQESPKSVNTSWERLATGSPLYST